MGIDIGTSACRAVIFDLGFAVRGKEAVSLSLQVPHPQWAEQDADQVLTGVLRAIRACLRKTEISPREILGIGLSGVLYSLLAVDARGQPLHPPIQWSDNRAEAQSSRLEEAFREGDLYRKTGCRNNAMYLLAKILWFKEELPSLYARVHKLISIKDYVAHYLTGGDFITDYIVASASGLFNIHQQRWDQDVLSLLDLPGSYLPQAVPPQSCLGRIRGEVARRTGLLEGTPVYAGGGDGPLSNIGAGVIEPGQLNLSIGSGGILRMILDRPRLCPAQRTWCYLLKEDLWILGGVNNGGMVLQWFWESFWGKSPPGGKRGKDRFALLDEWAASVPRGCEGLIFLPYLTGERSPNWRTEARGAFFGIGSHHQRAHFSRAVMEGLGYQMFRVFQAMEEISGGVKEIRFTGGFTRSPLWGQMMCDILGRRALVPAVGEASALGASAMAALGMGIVSDLCKVTERVAIEKVLHPDGDSHQRYRRGYGLFADLYEHSLADWKALKGIREDELGE
ncbi:MAG: FGGY family carbohydrate kinase [bacterium]